MRRAARHSSPVRKGGRRALVIAVLAFFAAAPLPVVSAPALAQSSRAPNPPNRIEIVAREIPSFDPRHADQLRFGALEFRGGLELTSSFRQFGGLSALRIFEDGARFVSLSDKGWWLVGRIVYADGRPVAIADAEMAPVLGADGYPLAGHGWHDTESIAGDGDTLYVGIERVNRIMRFDFGRSGVRARGQPIPVPPGIFALPNNKGLEAMAFVPQGRPLAGTLIAISERGLDRNGNLKAFLIGGPNPGEFSVKRSDDFDISDCALLPSGDLLVLERRFTWTSGVAIRVRRIALATVKPAAVVDGSVLMFADMGYQIDNMEGLAVHRSAGGDTILTMISDDNFSVLQRTILLQFRLLEE